MVDVADAARGAKGIATVARASTACVKKEKIAAADKDAALKRIEGTTDYDALGGCDLIIEAATENEELKVKILKTGRRAGAARRRSSRSNTSSISITRLAAATSRPGKFIGMHFFNPVPMMALVELIRGQQTEDATVELRPWRSRSRSARRRSSSKNSPGFVVNRILCPMINEAVFALQEGLASAGGHRQRHEAGLQPPDRPAGARRHGRPRRDARGDGSVLPRLQRSEVPAGAAAEGDGRRGPSRPQDRAAGSTRTSNGGAVFARGGASRNDWSGRQAPCIMGRPAMATITRAGPCADDRPATRAARPGGGVEQCRQHLHWTRSRACCCITPRSAATIRRPAKRTSASGRRGRGRRSRTKCARSPAASRPRDSSAACTSRSSATTGRGSTGRWLAAQALGGVPVPMYQDAPAAEFVYVLNDAEIVFAIVEDQEQVDKLLEAMPQVPTLAHIYYDDPRGLRNYEGVDELRRAARRSAASSTARIPGSSTPKWPRATRDDVSIMLYTSGTTGKPKGVCQTHGAFIAAARGGCEFDRLTARRQHPVVPADGVGRRPPLLVRAMAVRRLHDQLPRIGRHGDDRPARDRPDVSTSRRRASSRTC